MLTQKIIDHPYAKFRDKTLIQAKIKKSNKPYYVEPFLGSGSIFMNINRTFDHYYLAENDPSLYNMFFQLIKKTKIGQLSIYAKYVEDNFDLSTADGYGDFEMYFKKYLYYADEKEGAFATILLALYSNNKKYEKITPSSDPRTCGGHKISKVEMDMIEYSIIYLRENRYRITLKKDYEDVLYIPNSLQVINPPYYMLSNNSWFERDTQMLIENLNKDNDIVYIDLFNNHAETSLKVVGAVGPNFTDTERMIRYRRFASLSKNKTKNDEYLYINF